MARVGTFIISSLLLFSAQAASATGEDRFRIVEALKKERFISFDRILTLKIATEGGLALRVTFKKDPETYDRFGFTINDNGECTLNKTLSEDDSCEIGQTFIQVHTIKFGQEANFTFRLNSSDEVDLEDTWPVTHNVIFTRESVADESKLEAEHLKLKRDINNAASVEIQRRSQLNQQSEGSRQQTRNRSGEGSSAGSGRYAYCISSGNGPEDKSYFSAVFPLPSDWGLGGAAQVVAFRAYTKSHFASHNVSVSCMFESSRPAAISKRDSYMAETRSNHDVVLTDWKYGEGD